MSPHPDVYVPSNWPFSSPTEGTNPHSSSHKPHAGSKTKEHTAGGVAKPFTPDKCKHLAMDENGYCTACLTQVA